MARKYVSKGAGMVEGRAQPSTLNSHPLITTTSVSVLKMADEVFGLFLSYIVHFALFRKFTLLLNHLCIF